MTKKLVNLTMKEIYFVTPEKERVVLPPHLNPARYNISRKHVDTVYFNGAEVPVYSSHITAYDIPDPEPDTYYIVTRPVAVALSERTDLLIQDTLIREGGVVLGVKGLVFP